MADSKTPLESNNSYHIFNHAVGNEKLFISERNYHFFLLKLKKYLSDFIDIYSYCLLPNHFHLLVTIKEEESLKSALKTNYPNTNIDTDIEISKIISKQFSHLFNSYAQAFNKENGRKGSLFYNRFKRKLVESDKYFSKLIHYIHYNPVHHSVSKDIEDWQFSSYQAIISNKETIIKRDKVIELFGDMKNFKYCHNVEPEISGIDDL